MILNLICGPRGDRIFSSVVVVDGKLAEHGNPEPDRQPALDRGPHTLEKRHDERGGRVRVEDCAALDR